MALGFWINNKNCYGCKTCSIACKSENRLGAGVLQRRVDEIRQDDPLAVSFLSLSCNHCEEPACVKNCPVKAYEKMENGIVRQNHDLCIGCKTCIEACPYHAPSYDEAESKTHKCDMCYDRQERGELPACVAACPGMNLAVGEMAELQKTHQADLVSDDTVETKPNFVITVDPLLAAEPDDTAVAERAAEEAAPKKAAKPA
ncbi:4Fe-4S dicluster domain-containing protein [Gordonibacter sp.]|uniref:4Fe-4S dicluster domain-containing protein n=1 Tax=Gordonibacter sp. TaxID=1968902 RepID=UPI002FC6738C